MALALLVMFGGVSSAPAAPGNASAVHHTTHAKTLTLQGTVKTASDAALVVTGAVTGDLKVVLSKRGRVLRNGQTSQLSALRPGDTVSLRGHLDGPGDFTATLVMDAASETLAAQARHAPEMKVSAIDNAKGEVTLQSANMDVRIQVLRSRIRIGRKEMGATTDLAPGQIYGVRLSNGPDAQPAVVLSTPTGLAAAGAPKRSSRSRAKAASGN